MSGLAGNGAGGSGAVGGAGSQPVENGTPVAGPVPFVLLEWESLRDVLVTKRMLLGWSQSHLAAQTVPGPGGRQMHHNTVYRFEKRGYRGPEDLPVVLRLCEALGLELRLGVREVVSVEGRRRGAHRLGPVGGARKVVVPLSAGVLVKSLVEPAQPRVAVPEVDEEFGF